MLFFPVLLLLTANMLSLGKWNLIPNEHMLGTEPPHHHQKLGLFRVVQCLQRSMGAHPLSHWKDPPWDMPNSAQQELAKTPKQQ